jgi:alpha-tubulin suppressor-like RCC1 family protein
MLSLCPISTCKQFILPDGALFAWGSNTQGNLGQNDLISRSSPVQVGTNTTWTVISRGEANEFVLGIAKT